MSAPGLLVWLDDRRSAPGDDWWSTDSVGEVKRLLGEVPIDAISVDNDLGVGMPEGYTLVDWLCEWEGVRGDAPWPAGGLIIQTDNCVARDRMVAALRSMRRLGLDVVELRWCGRPHLIIKRKDS